MRRHRRTRVPAACLVVLAACACATLPPERQRFLAVETEHFAILSSLGPEATRSLATDLERFHAGVLFTLGLRVPTNATGPRTRVYAFDDRSLSRPFEVHGEGGYFLEASSGPVLVLRKGGGFREDATLELRHLYAHGVFRGHWPGRAPLWYEEGLCQVASTLELRGESIWVGLPRADHLNALRDWSIHSLEPVIGARDRVERLADRAGFTAESWALAHYLRLGPAANGNRPLVRYTRLLYGGTDPQIAARSTFASDDRELASTLNDYVRGRSLPGATLDARGLVDASRFTAREVPAAESRTALGELALALGRDETAEALFENALALDSENARAHSGLAVVARRKEQWEEAEIEHGRAFARAPDDPRILGDRAATRIARARSESGAPRERQLQNARGTLDHGLALDPGNAEAHAMWAETALVSGRDLDRGLQHADAARAARPASLELELLEARLRAMRGERAAALDSARDVYSRTHSPVIAQGALSLLNELAPSP